MEQIVHASQSSSNPPYFIRRYDLLRDLALDQLEEPSVALGIECFVFLCLEIIVDFVRFFLLKCLSICEVL